LVHLPTRIMDEKFFECAVCLEICRECINCTKCHQIFCKSHASNLSRCPVCRDAPFRFQENVALQRIIRDLKQRQGITTPPASPGESSAAPPAAISPSADESESVATTLAGVFSSFLAGVSSASNETTVSAASRAASRTLASPRAAGGTPALECPEIDPRYGSKVPRRGQDGQFKKMPTAEHTRNMKEHTRSCRHAGCYSVWNGPWGSFIGGQRGSTHFDLTECPEGRRLNLLIGWDYDDPAC